MEHTRKTIQVIETHHSDFVEWGISFADPNPPMELYFKCQNADDAFRLKQLIEDFANN